VQSREKKPVILVPLVRTKAAANSIPVPSHEITRIDTEACGKSGIALTINAPGTLAWKISPDTEKQSWTIAFQSKNVVPPHLVMAQPTTMLPRSSPLQLASLDVPASTTIPAAKPASTKRSGTVSLDFTATEVADILKALSIQSGINIVAGAGASGKVTVTLRGVSVTDALDWVTRLS